MFLMDRQHWTTDNWVHLLRRSLLSKSQHIKKSCHRPSNWRKNGHVWSKLHRKKDRKYTQNFDHWVALVWISRERVCVINLALSFPTLAQWQGCVYITSAGKSHTCCWESLPFLVGCSSSVNCEAKNQHTQELSPQHTLNRGQCI